MFATSQSRREFLQTAGKCAAAASLLSSGALELGANPLGLPIGCQTWPVREMIAKDFPGTIKQLAKAGFQTIELCSPAGYADSGFAGLAKYTGTELRKILSDAGVSCVSSHFGIQELRENQEGRITWAKDVGLTQMIVPSLDGSKNPTMDDVKRAADEYNKMGERSAQAGIQQGLHNEDFECSTVDGKRTYDVLLELLDPKLVKFQFQVSTISQGFDAAEYLTKYPGRFISMADFEDSNSPTWQNNLEGQINLRDAIDGKIRYTSPEGKSYELNPRVATLLVRPRGWHLTERHFSVDGEPISASMFDFGLYFFHNAARLIAKGTGPYFYLPKLESHLEARLWNDVFCFAQDELGIPRGTIRATVLIETILAAFEMDEILYELREHSSGLNCGRWDYIFSFIKKFRNHPDFVLPDRSTVTMSRAVRSVYIRCAQKSTKHSSTGWDRAG